MRDCKCNECLSLRIGAATYAMSSSNAAYPFPVTQTSREEERKQVIHVLLIK